MVVLYLVDRWHVTDSQPYPDASGSMMRLHIVVQEALTNWLLFEMFLNFGQSLFKIATSQTRMLQSMNNSLPFAANARFVSLFLQNVTSMKSKSVLCVIA